MHNKEIKRLLALSSEERLELYRALQRSVEQEDDVRLVPLERLEIVLLEEALVELRNDLSDRSLKTVIEA